MKAIWKYHIELCSANDSIRAEMPDGAKILDLQLQHGDAMLWALVDPEKPITKRIFMWVGTGREVLFEGEYVGTVQFIGGDYVFHLFEVTDKERTE